MTSNAAGGDRGGHLTSLSREKNIRSTTAASSQHHNIAANMNKGLRSMQGSKTRKTNQDDSIFEGCDTSGSVSMYTGNRRLPMTTK